MTTCEALDRKNLLLAPLKPVSLGRAFPAFGCSRRSNAGIGQCSETTNFMKRASDRKPCLGVIYGNRDFFPDQLVSEARADLARIFEKAGIRAIQLGQKDSKLGGVETHADARKCAELFRKHAGEIDGVLVVPAQLRRRKGRRRHAQTFKAQRAGAHPGLPGRPQTAQPGAAARRLLRQNLRQQQPRPGRHQIHPDDQTRLSSRPRRSSPPTCKISSASAAW